LGNPVRKTEILLENKDSLLENRKSLLEIENSQQGKCDFLQGTGRNQQGIGPIKISRCLVHRCFKICKPLKTIRMKKQRIKTNFNKRPDAKLIVLCNTVITSMTDNPNFVTPQPTMADLQTALDDFTAAVAAAKVGGDETRTIRDQKKLVLADLMDKEATYVELVSNGDVAKMQSSGFELTKAPAPIGPLVPKNFDINPEGKGNLLFSLDAVYGAKTYQFEYKKVGATEWITKSKTKSKLLVENLERGSGYVGRVVPIGSSDIQQYSNEVLAFVA
jgi:hypothetical protein